METQQKKIKLTVSGMHCANCEVHIERELSRVPGVERVKVNRGSGTATVWYRTEPTMSDMQDAVRDGGYGLVPPGAAPAPRAAADVSVHRREIVAAAILVFAAWFALRQFDIIPSGGASGVIGFGVAFGMGLLAAVSTCMAVTGGLLLSLSASWAERSPALRGFDRFRPHLFFNLGRIVSYTVLGGAVGALGSVLAFSPAASGVLTVIVSLVMVMLGIRTLGLFPGLSRLIPAMPKFIAHRIHAMGNGERKGGAFAVGALTFFLPCGFTQTLQLYALSTGSFAAGAVTLFAFALGTTPALLSLGALSSFMKGTPRRYFLAVAGVAVIALGISNIGAGWRLVGLGASAAAPSGADSAPVAAVREGDAQVVAMKVTGYRYEPSEFAVKAGVPVEWQVDGRQAAGCAGVISVPGFRITQALSRTDVTVIRFTPSKPGRVAFSCTMGMAGPGAFTVVE